MFGAINRCFRSQTTDEIIDNGIGRTITAVKHMDVTANPDAITNTLRNGAHSGGSHAPDRSIKLIRSELKSHTVPVEAKSHQVAPLLHAVLSKKHLTATGVERAFKNFTSLQLRDDERAKRSIRYAALESWAAKRSKPTKLTSILQQELERKRFSRETNYTLAPQDVFSAQEQRMLTLRWHTLQQKHAASILPWRRKAVDLSLVHELDYLRDHENHVRSLQAPSARRSGLQHAEPLPAIDEHSTAALSPVPFGSTIPEPTLDTPVAQPKGHTRESLAAGPERRGSTTKKLKSRDSSSDPL